MDRADPVFVGLLGVGPGLAEFPPGLEIVVGELAVFGVDDLGQLPADQAKGPAHADDVDGDVRTVQDQDTARQAA
jgi:hypothetical protein